MPPPAAVAGGKETGAPLSDEDRLTLVSWIDLGCPIDLDYHPAHPEADGFGWMLDDQRPTLTLTSPRAGANPPMARILVGLYDSGGLVMDSSGSSRLPGRGGRGRGRTCRAGSAPARAGVWELKLDAPILVASGTLTVSVPMARGTRRTSSGRSRRARMACVRATHGCIAYTRRSLPKNPPVSPLRKGEKETGRSVSMLPPYEGGIQGGVFAFTPGCAQRNR